MRPALSPDIVNEEEEYEVEEVRNHRKQRHSIQFLVYQKGYGNKHDQWISEIGLLYIKKTIEDYWTRVLSQNL